MPDDQHDGRDDGGAEGEQHAFQPDIDDRLSTPGRHQDHSRGKEDHVDSVGSGQVRHDQRRDEHDDKHGDPRPAGSVSASCSVRLHRFAHSWVGVGAGVANLPEEVPGCRVGTGSRGSRLSSAYFIAPLPGTAHMARCLAESVRKRWGRRIEVRMGIPARDLHEPGLLSPRSCSLSRKLLVLELRQREFRRDQGQGLYQSTGRKPSLLTFPGRGRKDTLYSTKIGKDTK